MHIKHSVPDWSVTHTSRDTARPPLITQTVLGLPTRSAHGDGAVSSLAQTLTTELRTYNSLPQININNGNNINVPINQISNAISSRLIVVPSPPWKTTVESRKKVRNLNYTSISSFPPLKTFSLEPYYDTNNNETLWIPQESIFHF